MIKRFTIIFLLFFIASAAAIPSAAKPSYDGKHEWRAVWMATVGNMDWPSAPGLSTQQQQQELIAYFDLFKKMNFNAIILQVRPAADAFYTSTLELWSKYLTGTQGKAPQPLYDPLAFAISEAHKRGMELHAWLNPYRVLQNIDDTSAMPVSHMFRAHPEWFRVYKKKLYFDPGYPGTRAHLASVVKDIVTRYDVDGIHMDDYFYPDNDFDDAETFLKFPRGFAAADKMAWRRDNVNLAIKMLRDSIKNIKPFVKFGISPYAVWRNLRDDPRGSNTKSYSYTNYDNLHADILFWMQQGWLDYVLPQLYFNIGYANADFNVLTQWWQQNRAGTPVYAGLGTYRLDAQSKIAAWKSAEEIKKQANVIRATPGYQGACYFNAKNFKENRLGINEVIKALYPHPALVPALKGFTTEAPRALQKIKVHKNHNKVMLSWRLRATNKRNQAAKYFTIYKMAKNKPADFTNGENILAITGENFYELINADKKRYVYYITVLDRLYNESKPLKISM